MNDRKKQPLYTPAYNGRADVSGYLVTDAHEPCETCCSDNHETESCPLNAERFVDPGEC